MTTDTLDTVAIEAALASHPMVASAKVERGIATVVPKLDCPEMEAEQLARWREVYDESFAAGDPDDMLQGWVSSLTGKPLPRADMDEWVEATVARIRSLRPRNVVEIGAGTGLLVERLAPDAESYLAIDASQACRDRLARLIRARPDLAHVEQMAADADDLPATLRTDTVILNSVVQYFPNAGYLTRVIARAANLIEDGAIFIGDVRDLRLLPRFNAARSVTTALEQEEELVIDPSFFHRLEKIQSRIRHIRVLLKRGAHQNELNSYRYDVILRVGPAKSPPDVHVTPVNFSSMTEIRRILEAYSSQSIACLTVDNLPNARLMGHVTGAGEPPVHPEHLFALGATLGYRGDLAPGPDPERFDAVFYRGDEPPVLPVKPEWLRPDTRLTNDPALPLARSLLPDLLRRFLDARWPGHGVAVKLANDRSNGNLRDKTESVEGRLVTLWREALQSPEIGADDDFFACGGSSLLVMLLRQRIAEAFGVTVPLSRFAEDATPRTIAAYVQDAASAKSGQ